MIISHNIPALMTQLSMRRSDRSLSTAMQRLSTGFRINSAKDDAAGLAIANKLSFQLGGQNRASENSTHGISLIQTAEGALNEVHAMLQRMRELAVQAANDTNTAEDRSQINREIMQLKDEIHDIANRTEFNRMRILNGEGDRVTENVLHHPADGDIPARGVASLLFVSDRVQPGSLPITVEEVGRPAIFSFPTPDTWIAPEDGSFMLNDNPFSFNAGDNILAVLTQAMEYAGIEMFQCESTETTHLMTRMAGRNQIVNLSSGFFNMLEIPGAETSLGTDAVITGPGGGDLQLLDVNGNPIPGTTLSTIINGNQITVRGTGGEEVRFNLQVRTDPGDDTTPPFLTFGDMPNGATPITDFFPAVGGGGMDLTFNFREFGPLRLQTGPSHNNAIDIHIPRLNAESLGLFEYVGGERRSLVVYTTRNGAQEAIRVMDKALETVSGVRARLGAFQNRLESTVDSLNVAAENTERSRSRIKDTDMARESTRFAQYNVMFQAAQAMLGQANQRPQQLLSLLQ